MERSKEKVEEVCCGMEKKAGVNMVKPQSGTVQVFPALRGELAPY